MVLNVRVLWVCWVLLLGLLLCAERVSGRPKAAARPVTKERTVNEIPNPMLQPEACGRIGVAHSAICDPDQLLAKDDQDLVEGYINAVTQAEFAVVVIGKMSMFSLESRNAEEAAEMFARWLHDKWGVGSKETNNGVLVFLSVNDRVVYISTGQGVQSTVTYDVIQSVIQGMRPLLRQRKYGDALAQSVIELNLAVEGKLDELNKRTHDRTPIHPVEQNGELWPSVIMFVSFVAVALFVQRRRNRQLVGYQRGTDAMNRLMTEVQRAEDNKFQSTSCPICLEDFPQSEVIDLENEDNLRNGRSNTDSARSASSAVDIPTAVAVDESTISESIEPAVAEVKSINKVQLDETLSESSPLLSNQQPTLSTSTTSSAAAASATDEKRKVMALKCGHAFCRGCLEEYLKTVDSCKCPICRVSIDEDSTNRRQPRRPQPPTQEQPQAQQRHTSPTLRPRRGFFASLANRNAARAYDYTSMQTNTGTSTATYTETMTTTNPATDPPQPDRAYQDHQDNPHRRNPEFLFRLHRMHYLYPDVMTAELLRAMALSVDRGFYSHLREQAMNRNMEIDRIVTEIRNAADERMRSSGSHGSSHSSFGGGGSSSGGGGGGW